MSDFWAQRLGVQTPPAAPQQPAQEPQAYRPWWAPPAPPAAPQQPVQQQPGALPPSINVPQSAEKIPIQVLLQQQSYTTTKAQSTRQTESCPDCGSGNYMRATPNSLLACQDCGYNERFLHSTHGVSATTEGLPQHVARGQKANVNDFNPKAIVGRVTI